MNLQTTINAHVLVSVDNSTWSVKYLVACAQWKTKLMKNIYQCFPESRIKQTKHKRIYTVAQNVATAEQQDDMKSEV